MSSRRSPLIVVMQPTYLWDFPDRAIPWLLNWPQQRTIHVQRPVCAPAMITLNWLRVLGTAELSQIDQGVRHQFHAKMALLHVFKPKQQPLEFVLPRKGPVDTCPQGMNSCIE